MSLQYYLCLDELKYLEYQEQEPNRSYSQA